MAKEYKIAVIWSKPGDPKSMRSHSFPLLQIGRAKAFARRKRAEGYRASVSEFVFCGFYWSQTRRIEF